jgi:DNA-directed RNA polymerase specialized sigma24 family protein
MSCSKWNSVGQSKRHSLVRESAPGKDNPGTGPLDYHTLPDADLVNLTRNGNQDAANALCVRLLVLLRPLSLRACPDPNCAEDLCHEAVLKLIAKLGQIHDLRCLRAWARAFLFNEARNWKRKWWKPGTPSDFSTLSIESTSVARSATYADDVVCLWDQLNHAALGLEDPCRRIGCLMLKHLGEQGELPSVRAIAVMTGTSHGAAQRYRQAVFACWRPVCQSLGFRY